ncbi:GHKL domain-containing protein [Clostridium sp. FP2]|uniref:sensor histidine kinase n=1 Tax=Clostridium sp. FP2 TaxID=2724481 RepID=UPI0013E9846A|nr:GHKL domain-containing protein [Clostridium sp. FP2]MBZ9621687.1 GHKL domain-containing protein [Clostridium sp. FP2]
MEGIIKNIVVSLILGISIFVIINNLKAIKFNNKSILFCILGNMMIGVCGIYTQEFLTLPLSVMFMFIFLFLVSRSIYNSIMIMTSMYFISAISDAICTIILLNILKIDYIFIKEDIWMAIILHLMILFFSYVISKVIFQFFFRKKIQLQGVREVTLKNNIIVLIYVSLSLLLIYLNRVIYKYFFAGTSKRIVSINMSLIFVYFIFGFITIYFSSKNIKKQMTYDNRLKEFEQMMEYTDIIENMIDESRKFKHDYINILSTINGYIQDKDLNGLEKYFSDEILHEGAKVRDNKYFNLQNIRISGLKGLLSAKIINASSLNLEVNTEIIEVIEDISVNSIDVFRVIGILLDNAIEAAVLTEDKKFDIVIINNDDSIVFIISNSFLGRIQPINKLYKKGFSTKGKNRGLGLGIVKDIIENYPNILLNTEINNNLFKQELVVYNKSK